MIPAAGFCLPGVLQKKEILTNFDNVVRMKLKWHDEHL